VNERRERRGRDRYGRDRQARQASAETVTHTSAPEAVAVAAAPAPVSGTRMPVIASYDLPMAELQNVAQSSGLEWVNSKPERIAQVQAAIAAEPRPIHVPRERPPAVVLDEGPLILVETKRDLGQMHMPFDGHTAA
jgi:ribonuclease E